MVRCSPASLTADLLLGDVHSLKGKRAVVRPIVAELRRRFAVSAAEVGDQDLHRRAQVGVATVAGDAGQVDRRPRRLRAVAGRAAGGDAAVDASSAVQRHDD